MNSLLQDLGYAFRTLRKSPGFAFTAILTLALGVGANTAIFSVTNSVLLHPHRFADLDRLIVLREQVEGRSTAQTRLTAADAVDLSRDHKLFQETATYQFRDLNLSRSGDVDSATGFLISPNLFQLLGATPLHGRTFSKDEGQLGRDRVLLLSYGYWQRRFGGDPNVVGSTISIDGTDATIIGIMPPDFNYPAGAEVWKPLAIAPEAIADRTKESVYFVARLAPGVSLKQVQPGLDTFASRLQREFPRSNAGRRFTFLRLREEQYSDTAPLLLMLQAGAIFVLLLACANLGVLTLVRLLDRRREFAVRTALGASNSRLLQMFFAETLLFSLAAGAAAIFASYSGVNIIRTSLSASYTRWIAGWDDMRVDGNVLLFALALVIVVAAALGVAAVMHASRIDPYSTMKASGGRSGVSRGHQALRNGLVVVQITLALILLVGAGLMINGFHRLQNVFAALDPQRTLRFGISLPESRYASGQITQFYDRLSEQLHSVPGLGNVGMITNNPASNVPNPEVQFSIEGRQVAQSKDVPIAGRQTVNSDIFSVLHMPLIDGRLLANSDGVNSLRVAVVSKALAQRYWPHSSAVGHRIRFSSDSGWITVVGVVSDIQLNWFEPVPGPVLYLPYSQAPPRQVTFLVRTTGNAENQRSAVRLAIASLDPLLSSGELNPYTVEVDDSLAPLRVIGGLMFAFGVVALALSGIGTYSVISHTVAQSTHEFGVRMALGAAQPSLMTLVLKRALRTAGVGLVLGCLLALGLARVARALVFGVINLQASVFILFSLLLLAVSIVAALLPAIRAARVDPVVALRSE